MESCPKGEALFKRFVAATKNHLEAAEALANLVGSRERFAEARLRAQKTFANLQSGPFRYGGAPRTHNCGTSSLEIANSSDKHPH